MGVERKDISLVEHDVEPIQIAGEAADFDMIALPDDHHVVAVAREDLDGAMRDVHQRAGGFDHRQSHRAGPGEGSIGGAVGRDHDVAVWTCVTSWAMAMPFASQGAEDRGVVNEVTEDRQRTGVSMGVRELDRIADAETHAEVGRAKDLHTLQFKVYCDANDVKVATAVPR